MKIFHRLTGNFWQTGCGPWTSGWKSVLKEGSPGCLGLARQPSPGFYPLTITSNSPGFQGAVPQSDQSGRRGGGHAGASLGPDGEHNARHLPLHQPGPVWEGQAHLLVPDDFSGEGISHAKASPERKSHISVWKEVWTLILEAIDGMRGVWVSQREPRHVDKVTMYWFGWVGTVCNHISCHPEKEMNEVFLSPFQVLCRASHVLPGRFFDIRIMSPGLSDPRYSSEPL